MSLGKGKSKYILPIQWLNRTEHSPQACYFCINNMKTFGFRATTRDKVELLMVPTVIESVRSADAYKTSLISAKMEEENGGAY